MTEKAVILAGVENARQLGGYTIGSKAVKKDVFIRSGKLNGIPAESAALLTERYGLRYIADFRLTEEQEALPDPDIKGAEKLHLPVLECFMT